MVEKSKNMDLEVISGASNDAVPAPEVEPTKKKKGWTLFRSSKSKSEESAKKEVSNDSVTNVKIISVKPKNATESDEVNGTLDEKGSPVNKVEDITNGDGPSDAEIQKVEELPNETDPKQPDDIAVPKKRWYHFFSKRSPKKNKTLEVTIPATDTLVEKSEAPLAEDEASAVESNEIEIIELSSDAEPKHMEQAASVQTSQPEKRKRLTLNFFRRSTKKNKKTEEISPTETVVEEIEIRLTKDDKTELPEDDKVETADDKAGTSKDEKTEIIKSETPINDELAGEEKAKDESKDLPADEPKEDLVTNDKSEQPEEPANVDAKRKRFTLKMFFRRSTKKDEKSPEEVPVTENGENDAKSVEINEIEPEPEKTEVNGVVDDENVKEVQLEEPKIDDPIEEPKIECPVKSDEPEIAKDEKLSIEDVPCDKQAIKSELPIGDNPNVGDVQNADEPNNDENLPTTDDKAEKSVKIIAESLMKEIE